MASKVQYPKTSGGSLAERERRRKTVQITMDGGGVQVAAPMTTPEDELRAIVRRRAPWILRQAAGEMPASLRCPAGACRPAGLVVSLAAQTQ